jgi:hypothetical protein
LKQEKLEVWHSLDVILIIHVPLGMMAYLDIKEKKSGAQKSCIQKTNAIFSIYKMSEQQKLGKIQKAKKFCNQIEKKINENILFRTLLWGNKIGRLLENY